MARFQHLSIASKLNLLLFIAMLTIFGGTGTYMIRWLGTQVEDRAVKELQQTNQQVLHMIEAYASALENRLKWSARNLPPPCLSRYNAMRAG